MGGRSLRGVPARDSVAYKAWARQAALRPQPAWSPKEQREIQGWAEGRLEDARVAALVTTRDPGSPDVESWVTQFNKKAMAQCARWGHPLQDTEDLVGGFWEYAFRTDLFSKWSPMGARLSSYVFTSFVHYFMQKGALLAMRRVREVSLEDLTAASKGPSPFDAVLVKQMEACLASLGLGLGEPGWLIAQVHVYGRTSEDLAKEVFQGPADAKERKTQGSRLRTRVNRGMNRLRRCLMAESEKLVVARGRPSPLLGA